MWLNGKYAAQNVAVYPDDDVMNSIGDFGTENAGCPLLINTTIRHIRFPHQLYCSTSYLPHYGFNKCVFWEH
jgi:hypothetical protein